MTDRELLELAAKSASLSIGWVGSVPWYAGERGERTYWDPITDDGDAFRLAVNLGINIFLGSQSNVTTGKSGVQGCMEIYGEDKNDATRRAIVRAAAEIGKSMT